jgi:Arc/MetJ-type ribon-helix-helix transcriptional regulator
MAARYHGVMTSIALPKDLEEWARAEVAAGRAASVETFVVDAMREHRDLREAHRALVMDGYADLDEGDVLDEPEADAALDLLMGAAGAR